MKQMVEREVYFARRYGLKNARRRSPTPMSPGRLDGWVRFIASLEPGTGDRLLAEWREVGWNSATTKAKRFEMLEMLEQIGLPYDPLALEHHDG